MDEWLRCTIFTPMMVLSNYPYHYDNHREHIGDSTRAEIEYAICHGKKLRYYSKDQL